MSDLTHLAGNETVEIYHYETLACLVVASACCRATLNWADGGLHTTCTECGREIFPRNPSYKLFVSVNEVDTYLIAWTANWLNVDETDVEVVVS